MDIELNEEQLKRLYEVKDLREGKLISAKRKDVYDFYINYEINGETTSCWIILSDIEKVYYVMNGIKISSKEIKALERLEKFLIKNSSLHKMNIPKNKLLGREEVLDLLEESLLKKRMKNTVLLGEAGCGKTNIIEHFAEKIKESYIVLELTMSTTIAGTKYRGDFEEKIQNALNEIIKFNEASTKKIILFIDEIHTIYKAGGADGAIDASNILKPYLSRGEITIIGATTVKEYNETIAHDPALVRRLSPIKIDELDEKAVISILQDFSENLVDDYFLKYIYKKSKNIKSYCNPDISIELLDRCIARCNRVKLRMNTKTIDEVINVFEKLNCSVITE